MDPKRFDNWTRSRAARLSRRNALIAVGAGGIAAMLPRVAVGQQACSLKVHAETIGGPSAPVAYDGVLQFTIDSAGGFTAASFTPQGQAAVSATGNATGRAIDFQIELGSGQTLAFSGAGAQPFSTCPDSATGIFSGPQPGDIGGWQASLPSGAAGSTTTGQTSTASQGASSSCPPPQTACGQNCCPGGATCTDTNQGLCSCPSGTTQCNVNCVPNCSNGQTLDLDSCSCVSGCAPDGGSCNSDSNCCSGACISGACQTCQFLACDGVGCVDPSFDSNNCGGCGVVCSAPTASCTDGVCACQPDGLPCVKHYDCCSDSCLAGICGCVTVGNDCSDFESKCCDNGVSTICISGFCRYIDPSVGHACFSNNECVTGLCQNGVCT